MRMIRAAIDDGAGDNDDDDAGHTFLFTNTQSVRDALLGFRCAIHSLSSFLLLLVLMD